MRIVYTVIICFSFFINMYGQTFSKYLEGHGVINYAGQLGGRYIVSSNLNGYNDDDNLVFSLLDSNGRQIWRKSEPTVSEFYPNYSNGAVILSDGHFVLISFTDSGNVHFLNLTKYNQNSAAVWSKKVYLPSEYTYLGTVKTTDNNFVAAFTGSHKFNIYKFSPAGDLIWNKTIAESFLLSSTFGSIVSLSDNSIILYKKGKLLKINGDGELTWKIVETKITDLSVSSSDEIFVLSSNKLKIYNTAGVLIRVKTFGKSFSGIVKNLNRVFVWDNSYQAEKYLYLLNDSLDIDKRIIKRDYIVYADYSGDNLLLGGYNWVEKTDQFGETVDIDLFAPTSRSLVTLFSEYEIKWYAPGINFINIRYSSNNGNDWQELINYYPAELSYKWFPLVSSDSCLIKIIDSQNPDLFDVSDSIFKVQPNNNYEYIAANEILMWVGNNGDGSHDPITDGNGFYWPGGINNQGMSAIFQDGLIWGGKVNGQIRVNGNTHRQGLRPGNILSDGTPADMLDPKYRVYKIKKNWEFLPPSPERDKYKNNFINWPVDLGAPWIDGNGDGIYTPGIDRPDYIGDEVLFYVANDLDTLITRSTYGSDPIGLEFQTTTYAFNKPGLENVVFKKYLIINKSSQTITDFYFGYWSDIDLGNASDDYVGCDTLLNLAYAYNGTNYDWIYLSPPPAAGHMLIQTPKTEAGIQDSAYYKAKWIKGYKNVPITSFVFYIGANSTYRDPSQGVYSGSIELYNYMQGKIWNGSNFIDPNTGLPTKFLLAGDPVAGIGWYEGPGWPSGPPPDDRRSIITCSPISMAPSDTQEVVIAILINKGTDNINSISVLKQDAEFYRQQYYNNFPVAVDEENLIHPEEFILYQNYPNPFNPSTKIRYSIPGNGKRETGKVLLKIFDVLGREVQTLVNKEQSPGTYEIEFNGSNLSSGVYFYRIEIHSDRLEAGDFVSTKKMILLR